MKSGKKLLSLILALCMVLSVIGVAAFAADTESSEPVGESAGCTVRAECAGSQRAGGEVFRQHAGICQFCGRYRWANRNGHEERSSC